ncbi:T9SS type A sorting domain-containing protein [candidate division KSB1 bacterium]|nr:T9SS type A sorting domain-containing protein [candidate division KSB1 bacterium]
MPSSSIIGSSSNYKSEVDLACFLVIASEKKVYLNWITTKEIGNVGFSIERKIMNSTNWKQVGFVAGKGEFYTKHEYDYEDEPGVTGLLSYRLKQNGADGSDYYSSVVNITIKNYNNIVLHQNYPNPFVDSTNIIFQLPNNISGKVVVKILDVHGQDVRLLYDKPALLGYYNIEWNSCDDKGKRVKPGIYTCILETQSQQFIKKMMKLSYKPQFD